MNRPTDERCNNPLMLACKRQKYDSIQAMRGIAAVSVIFNHIIMFRVGAFGVDLFFCISGFIMMFITEKNDEKFLQKRAVRIIPLYWLITFALIAMLLIIPQYFRTTTLNLAHVVKSLLFIPYTDDLPGGPLVSQGWTLVCEVFFYVVFFVSIKINHRYRHFISSAILCFVVVLSLIFRKILSPDILNYYGSSIMLEFIFGMFAFKMLTRVSIHKKHSILMLIAAIIVWGLLFVQNVTNILSSIDRLFIWGIPSLLFFVLVFKFFESRTVPKWLVFTGNISYSLYLVHTFIINPFSRLIYNLDAISLVGILLTFIIVIPLCFVVAFISWYIVEYKFTEFLRHKFKI